MSTFQNDVNEVIEIITSQKNKGGSGSHTLGLHRCDKRAVNAAIRQLLTDGKIELHSGLSTVTFKSVPKLDGTPNDKWTVNHFSKVLSTMNYSIYLA